jgi:hypothetical protein
VKIMSVQDSEQNVITIIEPDFLTQIWAELLETLKFVETKNNEMAEDSKLSSVQKYSWAVFLFEKAYKLLDIYFKFPEYVDKIIAKLPEMIELGCKLLHFLGEGGFKLKPIII